MATGYQYPSKAGNNRVRNYLAALVFAASFAGSDIADADVIQYTDSSFFEFFGTVTGDDHVYPTLPSSFPIASLNQFDPSLGNLTGIKLYASFVGNYGIVSHCLGILCNFTTTGSFSDGFSTAPPGASFSANGYSIPLRVTQADGCIIDCSTSRSGGTNFSEQIQIDPMYFASYVGTGQISFQRDGSQNASVRVFHETPLASNTLFLEACIDNCDEVFGALSLGAYIARQNHIAFYNDTHFNFYGRRFFQVDYTYEPFASSIPEPGAFLLLIPALGLLGLTVKRRVVVPQ